MRHVRQDTRRGHGMIGYIIAGVFALFALVMLWMLLGAHNKAIMLYRECLVINARWKAASTYISMRAVREALHNRECWTADDEAELKKKAEELENLGVSLRALGDEDAVHPSLRELQQGSLH